MFSLAFLLLAEEEMKQAQQQQDKKDQRIARRKLRDASNPLELPQALFEKYYRVNKPAFKYLLTVLTSHDQQKHKSSAVSHVVKLSAALRFFADGGYQTGVGKDCDVSVAQSSLSKILTEVITIFEDHLCSKWITFCRTDEQKRKIASALYLKYGIPNIMGCVDGTHVRIIAPYSNKHLYLNSKGYYSLNVILACDHELRIQYVDASHPGSYNDSFIWKTNDLRAHIKQDYLKCGSNHYLLGDDGYPLEPWLLTPHSNPQHGSSEFKFNKAHAKCHNVIERAIELLKSRWKCILGARDLHYTPEKAARITNVCCALHNICIHFKCDNVVIEPDNLEHIFIEENDVVSLASPKNLSVAENIRNNIGNSLQ